MTHYKASASTWQHDVLINHHNTKGHYYTSQGVTGLPPLNHEIQAPVQAV
jgi:hypothetical protein